MTAVPRIFTLLLLLLPVVVAAQRHYTPNLAIGGKAGATISQMSFSPKVSQTFTEGFMAGVVLRYTEERNCGIIAELNIEQRGWKEKYDPGEDFNYRRTLTYLQLPLLTHIRFGSPSFKGFVNLGPEIGVMIDDHISSNFDYKNISSVTGYPGGYRTNAELDMKASNRFDYGISAGVGMEYIVAKKQSLLLEGRFYYGLGNIFPSKVKDYFSASRGMSIEVTAGWLFRLK